MTTKARDQSGQLNPNYKGPQSRACIRCGIEFIVKSPSVRKKFCSRSCSSLASTQDRDGSANPNWRGGKTSHPLYDIYMAIIDRCTNPQNQRWADYGGRGITICSEWRNDFWAFVGSVGGRPFVGASIDRVNNDDGYHPGNVRWSDRFQQASNKRGYGHEGRARNDKGQFS